MKAFVLDPPRCTGCEACRVACSIENRVPMERSWRTVHHVNGGHLPGIPAFHLSLACSHCARPACLEGCPADAYRKDPATGAVLLDDDACIGCRYCSWMCPYDAPVFDAARGVMSKCTFCQHRLEAGLVPACAAACPTGALAVEERASGLPEPAFPGLFRGGLGPALRIVDGARPAAPEIAKVCGPEDLAWAAPAAAAQSRIALRSEWSLWLFTLTAMSLVGMHLGWTFGGPARLPPTAFLALGGLAAALSVLHLGRPVRAWRAIRNLRRSWLSREVLAFGLFLPLAAAAEWSGGRGALAWIAAGAGLLLLLCMDRLYQVAERRPIWRVRSSDLLPAGLHLAALCAGAAAITVLLALLRATGFLAGLAGTRADGRVLRGVARLAAFALPALVLARGPHVPAWAVLLCFLAGEALDRAGFYEGLELPSPARLLDSMVTSSSADPA